MTKRIVGLFLLLGLVACDRADPALRTQALRTGTSEIICVADPIQSRCTVTDLTSSDQKVERDTSDGIMEFSGIAASEYRVRIDGREGAGYCPAETTITLGVGESRTVSLQSASTYPECSEPTPDPEPDPEPEPEPEPEPDPPPPDPTPQPFGTPTLVSRYWWNHDPSGVDQRETDDMLYQPRQFAPGVTIDIAKHRDWNEPASITNAGAYLGWDVLATDNSGPHKASTRSDLYEVDLSREATVGVIWRGSGDLPSWLSGWAPGGTVGMIEQGTSRSWTVYEKVLGPGVIQFGGGENESNDYPIFVFAEADGSPSAPPEVPAGMTEPQPNEACPAWVHDRYVAEGPDGAMYPSWHRQIDPEYWCYFGHTHGSPAPEGVPTLYNYFEEHGGPMEAHRGFHGAYAESMGTLNGVPTLIGHYHELHATTDFDQRICRPYHGYRSVLTNAETGELLADLQWKVGPFMLVDAHTSDAIDIPTGFCPTAYNADGSIDTFLSAQDEAGNELWHYGNTTMRMRVVLEGDNGYESWNPIQAPPVLSSVTRRFSGFQYPRKTTTLRLAPFGFVRSGTNVGERFWFTIPGEQNDPASGFGIDTTQGGPSGEVCTDIYATTILPCGDYSGDVVRHYLRPNTNVRIQNEGRYWQLDPWDGRFVTTGLQPLGGDQNLEDGLTGQ